MGLEDLISSNDHVQRLRGKVAVITGGARGIGATTARLFAQNGAHVIIADILDELGSSLATSIKGKYIHCDVSKEAQVESAVQLAVSWKGQIDIMFNNAGISGPDGSITNLDMSKAKSVIEINVNGTIHGIKHAARAMIQSGKKGCIICASSSAAIMGGLASHSYTLSKEAILGIVKSSACELGGHGIRVNCISPHGVPSQMLVGAFSKMMGNGEMTAAQVGEIVAEKGSLLRGRCARTEDVAEAALFLASEEAAGYITGHNLVVDGGFTSGFGSMSFIYQDKNSNH